MSGWFPSIPGANTVCICYTCMYVYMCVCEDWMQEAEDDAKVLLYTKDFQLSHQKNPCYRSLMKIHQHQAQIVNKMCSFEVSIGLLPHFSIISSKESLLWKYHQNLSYGAEIFNKMCSFEVCIVFTPHFDCLIKRIPVIEVLWKPVNMEPRYVTKHAVLKLA